MEITEELTGDYSENYWRDYWRLQLRLLERLLEITVYTYCFSRLYYDYCSMADLGSFPPPVFDHSQYANMERKAWEI